ncbi:histidine-containing phosphotransfer protein 1-like [Durio zibethinus]|uniref:Histidine-containing phosphotransfer protein n=1 Tax=Durio zibethinus TaxID=66656 RepID=A0A6P5ZIM2_DURZI|nr:histidine-containing phosphotransfer protein 1-like [Durio zibethinus]
MVGTTLSEQLNNHIQTMHDQGILDHHFDHVKKLQNEGNPQFVVRVISMFFNDAETGIAQITSFLNSDDVDFAKTINYVHQLKGCSSSIGGQRMALACSELRNACDDRDKQRCLEIFERVKQEYSTLQECFNTISQMERTIANETGGRQP